MSNFGFGDFEFCLPSGKVLAKASNIIELTDCIKKIDANSLEYHASNNHLSNWLAARGEFIIASKFRKIKHGDFKNIEDKRKYYIELIDEKINSDNKTPIIDFSNYNFNKLHNFIRIGKGSLGGKARGIAFANSKITTEKIKKKYSSININIPKTIVISTNEFDDFMETNNLWDFALTSNNNNQIEKKFIKSKLSKNLINILKKILRVSKNPLAIRSSGLLEDSQYKPLAGMYSTYMLPNSNKKLEERLNQLCEAIKRVYASTFFKEPKSLMDSISQKYEEEKMAIIIMELIGVNHNNIYYPTISGVCQSFNYYPVSYMERGDGIAYLALGLGKTIADGEKSLRYCPKYPNILPQYYSPKASIENSQNQFYALNLNNGINPMKKGETNNLQLFNIEQAELDKELNYIASVVSTQDNIIRDSLKYNGYKILTFSSILKYNKNPINELIKDLLKKGEKLIGCPIEIEFAININKNKNDEFFLLQIKPMTIDNYNNKINIEKIKSTNQTLCYSNQVLGDGITQKIKHIIYVDTKKFKREATMKIAAKIGEYNKKLGSKNPYLLLGPGRWGTTDSWLGIPVNWEQITNAKVIIETGIDALNPDPSFGSHFFQNITSLRIGYFTIEKKLQKKNIDWNWIMKQEIIEESEYVKIIKLQNPITVKIDGINGEGIILKNDKIAENMNEIESSGI
ncbi:MAG: histidine kinase [Candidatus Marinimicrobia bacterium]|nr:histidine kinase [Candidatus Neomarinimicrobiota bacterium]